MFGVLLTRWRETESRLRQNERMAQLGTLTAGLAHELNNPAAAVQRSADDLETAMEAYATARARLDPDASVALAGGLLPAGLVGRLTLGDLRRGRCSEAIRRPRIGALGLLGLAAVAVLVFVVALRPLWLRLFEIGGVLHVPS